MNQVQIFVNGIVKGFCSFFVTFVLLLAYGSACAVATFVENDFGTPSAKALIYNTAWFDLLHLLLVLNLIGVLIFSRAWQRKKYASFLFHSSLIVIFIGAAMTRYYGFEGVMHIREGERSNTIESQEEFITILAKIEDKLYRAFFPTTITPLVQKKFHQTLPFEGDNLSVQYLDYLPAKDKMDLDRLKVKVSFKGESQEIEIIKNSKGENITPFVLGETRFALDWGSRVVALPFFIELKDFQLDRYAGSMSPSSYASEVVVIDPKNNVEKPYKIFMNNVLDYGGFRFFQSSYDLDEQGTILSVNHDPGKIPTYIGYTMLVIGLLWEFFAKNGRFVRLSNYLKSQNLAIALVVGLSMSMPLYASGENTNDTEQMAQNIESQNPHIQGELE
ncbi:MAG: cytochrome c biogenesis protein ResB, partial [Helicobacter sp.]|nr:cytochrome c biogenesis protein ResB [Helicobacter sp.]